MLLPHPVSQGLDDYTVEKWRLHFGSGSSRHRKIEEGIWRRTQDPRNALESGWRSSRDARRRIVHYRYCYDLTDEVPPRLAITDAYFFYSVSLPRAECETRYETLLRALVEGGWTSCKSGRDDLAFERGDLRCTLTQGTTHPRDIEAGRRLPDDYGFCDLRIFSSPVNEHQASLPWAVLAGGMRIKDKRGSPKFEEDLGLLRFLTPFHVEVGCGISVAAGVPPLHRLHELYGVTDRSKGRFIFSEADSGVADSLLSRPEHTFATLSEMRRAILRSEPSEAHWLLRRLFESGALLQPIFTNNFDGLLERVGLREHYLRRYDESVPDVSFDPRARALLVIGSHADRRRVQARARGAGLQVVFCDPEKFEEVDGQITPYPVEGAQDIDLLCRLSANEGLTRLLHSWEE
jgi:hypothetical protein